MSAGAAPRVTVGVVSICGERALARCLDALAGQEGAPGFEVVVVVPPDRAGVERPDAGPRVRFVARAGERTPPAMARRAVLEAGGEILALIEDHCAPEPGWLARLLEAVEPGRAAVGGSVAVEPGAAPVAWAVWFVDFFRYVPSADRGPSPTLTHCNVAYRRADLDAIAPLWSSILHETEVLRALAARGTLWLEPGAVVVMHRRPRLAGALAERYAFGRLFGASRARLVGAGWRLLYAAGAPVLPPLLLGRMARRALATPGLRGPFLRALPALVLLVLAWSAGEAVGTWTGREPASLPVAPDREDPPPGPAGPGGPAGPTGPTGPTGPAGSAGSRPGNPAAE